MRIDISRLRKQLYIPWNKQILIVRQERVSTHGRYWSGGTKETYTIYRENGTSERIPDLAFMAPNATDKWSEYTIGEHEIVVQTGVFCGKKATPTVYVRPETEVILDKKSQERKY